MEKALTSTKYLQPRHEDYAGEHSRRQIDVASLPRLRDVPLAVVVVRLPIPDEGRRLQDTSSLHLQIQPR